MEGLPTLPFHINSFSSDVKKEELKKYIKEKKQKKKQKNPQAIVIIIKMVNKDLIPDNRPPGG